MMFLLRIKTQITLLTKNTTFKPPHPTPPVLKSSLPKPPSESETNPKQIRSNLYSLTTLTKKQQIVKRFAKYVQNDQIHK